MEIDPIIARTHVLVPRDMKCHKCGASEPWKDPTIDEINSVVDDPKTWEGIEKSWGVAEMAYKGANMAGYKRWGPHKPTGGLGFFPTLEDEVALKDIEGNITGGLEVVFHHPLKTFTDYHQWVDDKHTLCRGSWPTMADLMWLKLNGINIVVNLCKERQQDDAVHNAGMEPINIEILDGSAPTIEQAVLFFRLMDINNNRVYVHCEAGHGRTGCICAYWRVMAEGWTRESALQEALFIAGGKLNPNQVKWIQEIK